MRITIGQALLLLIEELPHSSEARSVLEDLYLNGVTPSKQPVLQGFLQSEVLKGYEIDQTAEAIDKDASRRYFETHLCFETLPQLLANVDIQHLKEMNAYYFSELKSTLKPDDFYRLKCVLDLNSPAATKKTNLDKEISDGLSRLEARKNAIKKTDSLQLSDINKMQFLLHSAYYGIVLGNTLHQSPLQQRALTIYQCDKGRLFKVDNSTASTLNYGILKGQMPLPADDIARATEPFSYLKPSEQSTFHMQAAWPQENFSLLVHPFSNGISSTIINQLKSIMHGMQQAPEAFAWLKTDMLRFFSGFIATMLFQSGGHTLHEYVAPLTLREVVEIYKKELQIDTSALTLSALFKEGNANALENTFAKTIRYNRILLGKAKVNHEILTAFPKLRKTAFESKIPTEPSDARDGLMHKKIRCY